MADVRKFLEQYYFLAARLDEVSAYPIEGDALFNPMDPRNQAWHDANNKLLQLINQFKPDRSEHQMNMYRSLQGLKKRITKLLASYKKGRRKYVH